MDHHRMWRAQGIVLQSVKIGKCKGVYASIRLRKGLDSNCRITVAHVDLSENIWRVEW